MRRAITRDLALAGLPRERVLAAAMRLLDLVAIRAGGDAYAEEDGSRGLMTLLCRHARTAGDAVHLRFPGKAGQRFATTVEDAQLARCVRSLRRGRSEGSRLLAWRDHDGAHTLREADLNAAIRAASGGEFTAKDFRTLHGTIVAAVSLARARETETKAAQDRAVRAAVDEVAEALGNTAAVARAAYIDPEVFTRFEAGVTIGLRGSRERALLRLLR